MASAFGLRDSSQISGPAPSLTGFASFPITNKSVGNLSFPVNKMGAMV